MNSLFFNVSIMSPKNPNRADDYQQAYGANFNVEKHR
jgi:hypothetical protein